MDTRPIPDATKWRPLFESAITWLEKLELIISILQYELGYEAKDFNIVELSQALVIRGVVHIMWNEEREMYLISLSVNIEPLGAVNLVNILHLSGISELDFLPNFYLSKQEIDEEGLPVIYHGQEAANKFQDEQFKMQKDQLMDELETEYHKKKNPNVTFH
jgi:hypothetical protein